MNSVTSNRMDYYEVEGRAYIEERYLKAYTNGDYQEVQRLAIQVLGLNYGSSKEPFYRSILSTSQTMVVEKVEAKPLEASYDKCAQQSD